MDMDSQILSPPSSLSTPNQQQIQTASPSSLKKPPSITRRVPPPCWTHEETSALIESYHEKWYSLRRGNLRASHWEEVADAVTRICNLVVPSKTSVQCRHKVEKLRKRYRTEVQKSLMTPPHHRFSSSWVFFKRIDAMEKGPSSVTTAIPTAVDEDEQGGRDEEEEDDEDEQGGGGGEEDDFRERYNYDQNNHHNTAYNMSIPNSRNLPNLCNFDCSIMSNGRVGTSSSGGFRFRIPSAEQQQQRRTVPNSNFTFVKPKNYGVKFDENAVPNFMPNPNFTSSSSRFTNGGVGSSSRVKSGTGKSSGGGGSKGKRKMDQVEEMVSAVRSLGEGFLRMEQMKLEMAREVEKMRMDMELKRTEMILESQQSIVDAFAKGFSAKKKTNKMSSPPDS